MSPISANLMRALRWANGFCPRRDRLMVARHGVPGSDARAPSGGTVEVMVSPRDICRRNRVHAALETPGIPVESNVGVQSKPRSVQSSRWDEGYFSDQFRHFVPGYYHPVPPGQNTFSPPIMGFQPWEPTNPGDAPERAQEQESGNQHRNTNGRELRGMNRQSCARLGRTVNWRLPRVETLG